MRRGDLGHLRHQRGPALQRARLLGGPGPQARLQAARGVIGVGLRVGDALDGPADPDLAPQALPVHDEGRLRRLGQLAPLLAVEIGVEDED